MQQSKQDLSKSEVTHAPRPVKRVPPSKYTADFLERLKTQGKVQSVAPDWTRDKQPHDSNVTWVLHPNGDLERL